MKKVKNALSQTFLSLEGKTLVDDQHQIPVLIQEILKLIKLHLTIRKSKKKTKMIKTMETINLHYLQMIKI